MTQEDKKIKISVYENRIIVNIHPYNPFFNDEYVSSLPPTPQKVIKRDQPSTKGNKERPTFYDEEAGSEKFKEKSQEII